jgi:hypothetical protein
MIKENNPGTYHNQMIVTPKTHNPRQINDYTY